MSIETVVLDPASLLVNRKAKQRKTDRIDAKKMLRALLAHDRGDATVLSRVRIPSVEEEDRKRLIRERRRLVKERTSLTNSIKALLKLHGVFDLAPRARAFQAQFANVKTAYGSPLPPRARQEILRLADRLALAERQIAEVEAERDGGRAVGGQHPDRGCSGWQRCTGGGEDCDIDAAEGHRRERRDRARPRDLLPRLPQPPRARELGRADADSVGKWGYSAGSGHRRRRSGMDPGPPHPDGVALVAPSAREPAFQMVRRSNRRSQRAHS